MILVKVHTKQDSSILSLCDKELIGKKFEDIDLQLDLTSNFYKGEEMTKEEVRKILLNYKIINAVGQRSVNLLLEFDLIDTKKILYIQDIPHAQCINLNVH
jgi:hypothetical protein